MQDAQYVLLFLVLVNSDWFQFQIYGGEHHYEFQFHIITNFEVKVQHNYKENGLQTIKI